ncbi:hypothetical protein AU255_03635 [Methyloprofundus sedimenti]|uniref:Integrase catalytic domain-containing protein n=1 Tax=Methyloprofundus sedimenti TaxID=1420851 RepID=A0A1V8M6I6_9GAMM|nr:hypothetical protein AU255_03635 [Methyloprofundus sedimenti]
MVITADNGKEFVGQGMLSEKLETNFFFAHPYASWERGLNVDTYELIRQYIAKGCSFVNISN